MAPLFIVRCSCGREIVLEYEWLSRPVGTWPLGYHDRHPPPHDLSYQLHRTLRRLHGS